MREELADKIMRIYNKLQDEESKELFNLRIEYAIYHNTYEFYQLI